MRTGSVTAQQTEGGMGERQGKLLAFGISLVNPKLLKVLRRAWLNRAVGRQHACWHN